MKVDRRQLLIGAASAALPSGLIKPNPLRAATEAGWGIHLDGSSGFTNPGGIPEMSQSTTALFGYIWRSALPPGGGYPIVQCGIPSTGPALNGICFIQHIQDPVGSGQVILEVGTAGNNLGSPNQLTWAAWWDITGFFDNNLNTTIVSIDTIADRKTCTINGMTLPLKGSVTSTGEKFCNFQNKTSIFTNGSAGFIGDIADFDIFAGGSYIDAGDPDNISGFFDVETGYATRKASDGSGIISGRKPQVHLSGPMDGIKPAFPQNMAAADSTWPATVNLRGQFTVIGNPTTMSLPDPFEPGSPT